MHPLGTTPRKEMLCIERTARLMMLRCSVIAITERQVRTVREDGPCLYI